MKPSLFLDILFCVIRFPVMLVFLPWALLAGAFKIVGEFGEWLDEKSREASRVVVAALNPRAWARIKQHSLDRLQFERQRDQWMEQAKFQAEILKRYEDNVFKGSPAVGPNEKLIGAIDAVAGWCDHPATVESLQQIVADARKKAE